MKKYDVVFLISTHNTGIYWEMETIIPELSLIFLLYAFDLITALRTLLNF